MKPVKNKIRSLIKDSVKRSVNLWYNETNIIDRYWFSIYSSIYNKLKKIK